MSGPETLTISKSGQPMIRRPREKRFQRHVEFYAVGFLPVYVVQPHHEKDGREAGIPILLSHALDTVSLALGKRRRRQDTQLHIRSDAFGGIDLARSREGPSCYYVVGGVRRNPPMEEIIMDTRGLVVKVGQAEKHDHLYVVSVEATKPTLVVSREQLIENGITPELADKEANPHFSPYPSGEVDLTHLTFEQLVAQVREKLAVNKFILI